MASENILGAIANPYMADIAGALDYRAKRLADDEAKRKEIRTQQLVGQALSSGLAEGSVLAQLAKENPSGYLAFAKATGLDPSDGAGVNQMAVDANTINKLANGGQIQEAFNYMKAERDRRAELGLNTSYLDKGLEAAQQDPHRFFNAVDILDNSLNPKAKQDYINVADGGAVIDSKGKLVYENQKEKSGSSSGSDSTAEQKNWAEYQRLRQTDPEQAEQFARATRFSSTEGQKLSPFAEKELSNASDEYNSAMGAASRYKSLAEKLSAASNLKSGLSGTWGEFIKEQTGNQDELTALRKEALSISNSEAINNLPPGPATDRDIEIAKAPFPTEKASPKYVADWLGAVSRLTQKKAEYAEFKANYIGQNGTVRGKDGSTLVSEWKKYQKSLGGSGADPSPPGITKEVKQSSLDDLVNKYAK